MDVVAAVCVSVGILSLGLAGRRPPQASNLRRFINQMVAHHRERLAVARIPGNPRTYLAMSLIAPVALFAIGWLQSPVLAISAGIGGLLMPRLYVAWLVHGQSRRSEAEAPRLLQSLLSGLTAGGTYLEALRQARLTCTDPWIREDLDLIIQRFMLDAPLQESLEEVHARATTRNLGLIWETLRICADAPLPTQAARNLLLVQRPIGQRGQCALSRPTDADLVAGVHCPRHVPVSPHDESPTLERAR
ncbi:MAG: hypothetical protein E6J37_11380 [Chloroflexi bacterium]|nr:MAG: hypothetical protein E6J37_11380 [Chloroflexota bacterium]